jgi:hypothetical protein
MVKVTNNEPWMTLLTITNLTDLRSSRGVAKVTWTLGGELSIIQSMKHSLKVPAKNLLWRPTPKPRALHLEVVPVVLRITAE